MEDITQQLYNDFTTKLLPKIGEGLQITKEYFTDLFGRYIKYLILTDSVWVAINAVFIILGLYLIYLGIKNGKKSNWESPEFYMTFFAIAIALLIFGIMPLPFNLDNLIKDIYIPEIRILQIIKSTN